MRPLAANTLSIPGFPDASLLFYRARNILEPIKDVSAPMTAAMHMRKAPIDPVTISQAHEYCNGVQVHCMRCSNMRVIGLDCFKASDQIPNLPKQYRFSCQRCGGAWVETRPNYVIGGGYGELRGLEK